MTVAAVLKQKGDEVITVTPATSVTDIARIIASRRIGAVVVCEGDHLAGIVSERDVVKVISAQGEAALRLTAADIMTKDVTTATPSTTVNEAMAMMDTGYFRHLPVVENGKMVASSACATWCAPSSSIRSRKWTASRRTSFVARRLTGFDKPALRSNPGVPPAPTS